jgi:glycosyltransferase involved in cell wall biosynthesis
VVADGKFFRLDGEKFLVKGVAYGPFAPGADESTFPPRARVEADLELVHTLGANVLRVYAVPPVWFLDLAIAHNIRLLIDVPWHQQACFLDLESRCRAARETVRRAAEECAQHPATFAISVANEIPADVVRWSGARNIEEFVDGLVGLVKHANPDCLTTFGNFPPTEYLDPREVDFPTFNVYLHRRREFEEYLARLQMQADTRPLLIGECGVDSLSEGEGRQAEMIRWQVAAAFRGGAAGIVLFSFTDDWHRGGRQVSDWAFGLTRRNREPKPAFAAARDAFTVAPALEVAARPRVSVVIAAYNAARTLRNCLHALQHLRYPDYEVLLVDDGSTDGTADLVGEFPFVRYFRHSRNLGLSEARNTGIKLATGKVVAFTDADCRPDEDWLNYLMHDLLEQRTAGIGGHNLLPPDDSALAAAVMAAPGGPLQVMLNNREAEHLPGCNMAFWRATLLEIGGFDPVFRCAGDDVDLCWRLQDLGERLGFSPGGFVWHYRRSTVRGYLRQQHGYGDAEAMLERKHPGHFNRFGGSRWRGRIYGGPQAGAVTRSPMIYHGRFGTAMFQTIYRSDPSWVLTLATSLEYYVLFVLPLVVLGTVFRWLLPMALLMLLVPLLASATAAFQVKLPLRKRRLWSRPMVTLLFLLQPLVRGWARYQGRLFLGQTPRKVRESFRAISERAPEDASGQLAFLAPAGLHRETFLVRLTQRLQRDGWRMNVDSGWSPFDLEVYGSRWSKLRILTASEYESDGRAWIRCRLQVARTLPARMAIWLSAGLAVSLMGLHEDGGWLEWLWLLLPLGLSLLQVADQRRLRSQLAVLVRRVARELGSRTSPVEPSGTVGESETRNPKPEARPKARIRSAETGRSGRA